MYIQGFMFILFTCITGVKSLECYSCYFDSTHKTCNEKTETCSDGQVCYSTVHRHDQLYKRYFKGCKVKSDCYDLQEINKNCDIVPNQCTYCCQSDKCNVGGASGVNASSYCIFLAMLISVFLSLYA